LYRLILFIILILFCFILTLILYFSLKTKSSFQIEKSNSLTIHHDVIFTIEHSLWNQTLDYIDEQSIYQIPYRFSNRHRNINGQLSVNIPSNSDIEILKISVPLLNQYPSNSIISFDSQVEIDEFNKMTSICIDNESLDNQCKLDS